MTFPITTERTTIRPLALIDLASFVSYRTDPDIARYQSWDTSYSAEQATQLIESQQGINLPAKDQWLQLAICSLETDELIGDLALHALAEDNSFEIGFTIAKRHQGKGYAKESAARLLKYLFEEVGAKSIIASTDNRNASSIKLLEALGFTQNPDKTWQEEFKNEIVTVLFFELTR